MALVNEHFLKLQSNYLFSDIAKKVNSFKITHPKQKIIRMGIGDVTQPLAPAVIEAMHKAVDEMASKETFHGYGPEQGYPFLIDAIIKNDYESIGVSLEPSEVFISDGAKSDCGNIGDLLRHDNSIGVTDPVYPVYIDSNVMSGRTGTWENGIWSDVVYIPWFIRYISTRMSCQEEQEPGKMVSGAMWYIFLVQQRISLYRNYLPGVWISFICVIPTTRQEQH